MVYKAYFPVMFHEWSNNMILPGVDNIDYIFESFSMGQVTTHP